MRFVREFRFLLLLALALSLFGGELVESFRLIDDVSNDFVQVSAARIHKCPEAVSRDAISHGNVAVPEELNFSLALVSPTKPALSPTSALDLLRLLSIQRK